VGGLCAERPPQATLDCRGSLCYCDVVNIDWTQAACWGKDHNAFFVPEREEEGKAICRECPISTPCLEEATILCYGYGIFGEMNQEEREQYRHSLLQREEYSAYRTA
jgi:hypothetical protein